MSEQNGVKRYEPRFDMQDQGYFMLEVDGEPVEAHGKTYVLSEDYDRLAALMPRVWTAETIKEAPEGYCDEMGRAPYEVHVRTEGGHSFCTNNAMYRHEAERTLKIMGGRYFAFGPRILPAPTPPKD